MTTLVTGATGRLGTPTMTRLVDAGHEVTALSRRGGRGLTTGDLVTGSGIRDALRGVEIVVHLATTNRATRDVVAARTLLAAAAHAGVRHLVVISIVGIDDIPLPLYRGKVTIERLVRESGVPHTILRATQFHSFVERLFAAQRSSPVIAVPAVPLQPIAAEDVADRLVELAGSPARGRVADIGGPERHDLPDLARLWVRSTGTRHLVLPLSIPGKTFSAYRAGSALVPGRPHGTRTFADHLAARTGSRP